MKIHYIYIMQRITTGVDKLYSKTERDFFVPENIIFEGFSRQCTPKLYLYFAPPPHSLSPFCCLAEKNKRCCLPLPRTWSHVWTPPLGGVGPEYPARHWWRGCTVSWLAYALSHALEWGPTTCRTEFEKADSRRIFNPLTARVREIGLKFLAFVITSLLFW